MELFAKRMTWELDNDDNAHLKNEGWSVMDDPFYEGKQILFIEENLINGLNWQTH